MAAREGKYLIGADNHLEVEIVFFDSYGSTVLGQSQLIYVCQQTTITMDGIMGSIEAMMACEANLC